MYQIKICSQKSSTAKNESQTHKNIVTQRCPCDWALSRFWKINWSCDIRVHLWLNYYYYYICKTILWHCSQLVCRLMESKLNTYVSLCSLFSRARESDSSLKNEPVAVGRYTVRVWKQKPDEFRCICSNLNRFDFSAEIQTIFATLCINWIFIFFTINVLGMCVAHLVARLAAVATSWVRIPASCQYCTVHKV